MDSLHTGCRESVLVLLENDTLCLYIKGIPKHPRLTLQPEVDESMATYAITCKESIRTAIDGAQAGENRSTTYYYKPMFYEQQNYQIIIENKQDKDIRFDHDQLRMRESVTYLGRDQKLMSGILNFRNEIGYTDLRIWVEGELYLTLTLEVFPSKMSYKADYKALLKDINEEIYNLSFDFLKATYTLGEVDGNKPSLTEFYSILRQKFEALMRAIHIILERPHHELGMRTYIGKPKAKYLTSNQSFNYLRNHPGYVERQNGHFIPKKALHVVKEITYDTRENQLVKYWIKRILDKVEKIRHYYNELERKKDPLILQALSSYGKKLKGVLRAPVFANVAEIQVMPNFSLVLQMAPGYREVYKLYMLMMRGLSLIEGQYQISTKNVAELYEYWCFIKLGALLRDQYELVSQDLIKVDHKGIFVVLKKGEASELQFKNPVTKEIFKLKYNAKGTNLPTVNQKPDNILELKKEIAEVTYKYIFDAKYKVDYVEKEGYHYAKPTEQDINTMHRYRDAIVHTTKQGDYEKTVFGAFVLFPGSDETRYKEDAFYESIQKVGIGGFPFLPLTYHLVGEFLQELVEVSGHNHYQDTPVQQGMTKYLEDLHIEKRNVLVAPIRSREQLEGIKAHRLYHIPLKNIRNRLMQIEYVAIYESKDVADNGGIYYYGKVKQVEIKQRKQLTKYFPTHRGNLEEDYVVYWLEELVDLKEPILAKGYGVPIRMYTNKGLLDYARTIPELSIKTKEEFKLYLAVKRARENYEGAQREGTKQYVAQVGAGELYIDGDNLIYKNKEEIKELSLEQFFRNPRKVLRLID